MLLGDGTLGSSDALLGGEGDGAQPKPVKVFLLSPTDATNLSLARLALKADQVIAYLPIDDDDMGNPQGLALPTITTFQFAKITSVTPGENFVYGTVCNFNGDDLGYPEAIKVWLSGPTSDALVDHKLEVGQLLWIDTPTAGRDGTVEAAAINPFIGTGRVLVNGDARVAGYLDEVVTVDDAWVKKEVVDNLEVGPDKQLLIRHDGPKPYAFPDPKTGNTGEDVYPFAVHEDGTLWAKSLAFDAHGHYSWEGDWQFLMAPGDASLILVGSEWIQVIGVPGSWQILHKNPSTVTYHNRFQINGTNLADIPFDAKGHCTSTGMIIDFKGDNLWIQADAAGDETGIVFNHIGPHDPVSSRIARINGIDLIEINWDLKGHETDDGAVEHDITIEGESPYIGIDVDGDSIKVKHQGPGSISGSEVLVQDVTGDSTSITIATITLNRDEKGHIVSITDGEPNTIEFGFVSAATGDDWIDTEIIDGTLAITHKANDTSPFNQGMVSDATFAGSKLTITYSALAGDATGHVKQGTPATAKELDLSGMLTELWEELNTAQADISDLQTRVQALEDWKASLDTVTVPTGFTIACNDDGTMTVTPTDTATVYKVPA